jgi:hypothetical protein
MDRGDAYARLMRGEVVQIGKHERMATRTASGS